MSCLRNNAAKKKICENGKQDRTPKKSASHKKI